MPTARQRLRFVFWGFSVSAEAEGALFAVGARRTILGVGL